MVSVARVLLTGIHLMDTGRVETDVRIHSDDFGLSFIPELIERKRTEKIELAELDWRFHAQQLDGLEQRLLESFETSKLPHERDVASVDRLLVRLRLESIEKI